MSRGKKNQKNQKLSSVKKKEKKVFCDESDETEVHAGRPETGEEREHNAYLRLMQEYKEVYNLREKCIRTGTFFIILSAAVFLLLAFSLDSKAFFLVLWIVFILASITVITRIDYRCYKFEQILGIKHTEKEDDFSKIKSDVRQKIDTLGQPFGEKNKK